MEVCCLTHDVSFKPVCDSQFHILLLLLLSRSFASNSLQLRGLQHTRLSCPSRSVLKLMAIESVMSSNHLILCHSLLLPSIFPSVSVFSDESALHIMWPKYWSFSFSFRISPSNEYSGLIGIDWFDLLAVQGTLKSPTTPQFKSINSSVLNLLNGSTFTSIHDYWKNHSFDYTDICWQSNVSAF